MGKSVQINQAAAVQMFEELGIHTATKWKEAVLVRKLEGLEEFVGDNIDEEVAKMETKESKELLKTVLNALDKDLSIEIVGDEAKPAKKGKKSAENVEDDGDERVPIKPAKSATAKKAKKGKGSCARIVELLTAATEKNPTTVDKIVKTLVKEFPQQAEPSMRNTVKGAYHWMPECNGIIIRRNAEGELWADGTCEKGTKARDIPRGKNEGKPSRAGSKEEVKPTKKAPKSEKVTTEKTPAKGSTKKPEKKAATKKEGKRSKK